MARDMIAVLNLGSRENERLLKEIQTLGVDSALYPHSITAGQLPGARTAGRPHGGQPLAGGRGRADERSEGFCTGHLRSQSERVTRSTEKPGAPFGAP